jgi:methionine-rich copper-binding protein CopC
MSTPTAARSAVPLLIATFLITIVGVLPVTANSTPQTIPFTQDWSNTGLITADDNWTAVPGIVGSLGNNLTATTDTDPQTVLVGGDVVDVIANQTDPSLSQGGVAEFQIGNPVVALQGTSTADAPNVVITLNTVGRSNIHVSFVLRDLDGTTDNAVQPVAVQYRVGATGTYTNLPAGFVADATSGPNLAILTTPVEVGLPALADDKSIVNVRIISTNASGNDEWVGIDDISVIEVVDDAPAVQSTTPGEGAVDVRLDADLSVTFSEPVNADGGWFTIDCTRSGAHAASVSGGPSAYTLDPTTDFAYAETCTMTVLGAGVTDMDTNDPPDGIAGDSAVSFTTPAPPDAAPTVVATTPADGDTGIAVGASLRVTFDEPVDLSTGWQSIACGVSGTHTAVVSGGPTVFDLDLDVDLAPSETCTLTINAAQVTDQDTNDPPDAMSTDTVVSFTTAAPDEPPSVVATTPADGAMNVALDADVSVTFDEPVDVTGSWYAIECGDSGSHAATVTGGPTTYSLGLTTDLAEGESCTVTVFAVGVTDQDANDPHDSMAADASFVFTTVEAAPTVNAPPTVQAGGPYTVIEGGSVSLAATGSDPDGDPISYDWDLDGDGTFETTGQTATFSAAGIQAPASQTIRVRGSDPGGLADTDAGVVNVILPTGGFGRPIDDSSGPVVVKAGSVIPVKFSLGGNRGIDVLRAGYPASKAYTCGATPPDDANQPAASVGPGGLRYDSGADMYSFQWKTDKAWDDTCRVFVVGLKDGTNLKVAFQFN